MENWWLAIALVVVVGFMALFGSIIYRDNIRDEQEVALRAKCIAAGGMIISVSKEQHHCLRPAMSPQQRKESQ